MVAADEHGEDVGYMPFPITIGGQQYASSGADYSYGINVNSSEENQAAAMVFVKWLTEESGFAYNEGGIPIELADNDYPDAYEAFGDVIFVSDESAAAGEEDLLNALNADSDLMINAGGKDKSRRSSSKQQMEMSPLMTSWQNGTQHGHRHRKTTVLRLQKNNH